MAGERREGDTNNSVVPYNAVIKEKVMELITSPLVMLQWYVVGNPSAIMTFRKVVISISYILGIVIQYDLPIMAKNEAQGNAMANLFRPQTIYKR